MDPAPPARGFQMKSPDITIKAGQEITYCWYFKTPNTEAYTIKRWVSHMTSGSHHMIMFFTNQFPSGINEGDVSSTNCGFGGGQSGLGAWVYAAQNEDADLALPTDDGAGKPVGMDVNPGQIGFFQMHYLNTGDADITVHVTLNAEAYDAGVATTKTAAYITYNANISIPPMSEPPTAGTIATNTCAVPAGVKMWLMSTHAHKQAVHTEVRDGTSVVFSSDDWEHPGTKAWMTTPFYTFSGTSPKLTYECQYKNPTANTIVDGDSAQTNEMCMATGYYFPATKATICYNNIVLP